MVKLEPFAFCTNNVPGNDLKPALDMARDCGFTYVELSAIDGISEQINADEYSLEYVRRVRSELEQRELICYAVSGHCDMTDERQFQRLLKKIRFAGEIGAKVLNTRCGPKARYARFLKNVKEAARLAASYGLMLHLESYGDIVGPAAEAGPVFAELRLENVRYTYDAGNTFRFARGNIRIPDDLKAATIVPAHLHMKDASLRGGWIYNEPIGEGQLDIPAILSVLEGYTPVLPCSLEIPSGFRVRCEDLSFDHLHPDGESVRGAVARSVAYLRQYADFELQCNKTEQVH